MGVPLSLRLRARAAGEWKEVEIILDNRACLLSYEIKIGLCGAAPDSGISTGR